MSVANLAPIRGACLTAIAVSLRLPACRIPAGLPEEISALRVFDVIAWMDGEESRPGRAF